MARLLASRLWLPAALAISAASIVQAVAAHALPISATPSPGSELAHSPSGVVMIFNEAPDPRLSSISVRDAAGSVVSLGSAASMPGAPNSLRVQLTHLGRGVYRVAWRVVSAVDGHLAAGSFAFGVLMLPPAQPIAVTGPPPDDAFSVPLASIAGRWLLYAGLFVILGAAFVGNVIYVTPPRATLPLALAAWAIAGIGLVLVVSVQASEARVGLATFLGSSVGRAVIVRGAPILVAGIAIASQMRARQPSIRALGSAGIAAAGALLADAATSHAAAGGSLQPGHPAHFDVLVQWVHVSAAGVWLGGLFVLLVCLRGQPGVESGKVARRFALSAMIAIAAVAATGLVRALTEIGPFNNLFTTDFGRLLLAKSALLLILAGLGAINHFRSVPQASRMLRPLRRIGSAELAVGAIVLLLTASLVNLAPPASTPPGVADTEAAAPAP